jgi:hypothetical protein
MLHARPSRLPALAAATAAASLLGVAPALATEGPAAPAGPPLPPALAIPNFAPIPAPAGPAAAKRARPVIRRARLVPRSIRRGRRSHLRLSLSTTGRVRIVIQRKLRGRYGRARAFTVAARTGTLSVRLPRSAGGKALAAGRYRITVVAIDSEGGRSRPVRRVLLVRSPAR